MKYRVTAVLFVALLMGVAFANWRNFYQERESWLEDLENETDLAGVVEDTDEYIQDQIFGEYVWIEAYGLIQKILQKHEIDAFDLVIDKAGYLHSGNFYTGFPDDQKKIAINVRRLSDYAAEYGSSFLFAVTPMKTVMGGTDYMGIPYNDFNLAADDVLRYLRYYNVDSLDLRKIIEESGLSYEETYYKTDHHWKTMAAFEGYAAIAGWLEGHEVSGLYRAEETTDLASYQAVNYAKLMFGSQGRESGMIYAGIQEDFEAYFPKEDGDYSVKVGNVDDYTVREGKYSDVILRAHLGEAVENIYEDSCYDLMFLHGLSDYLSITNLDNEDGLKVLLLRDSYSSPIGCFLAQNCGQLDLIYMLGEDREQVLDLIEDNHYDYVIMCIYPENLSLENLLLFEDVDYE